MQTVSPFSLSSKMFVLPHSGHFSASHMAHWFLLFLF
jgi:hypothetical protein